MALLAALGGAAAGEALTRGHAPGFGVAACLALIAAGTFALRPTRLAPGPRLGLAASVAAALLTLAENVSPLSAALALAALALALDPAVIADYNLRHAREMGGQGVAADLRLLADLGPSALPAIEALLPRLDALGRHDDARRLRGRRDALLVAHQARMANWRARSFRALRLQARLDQIPSDWTLR